ncbi:MAG TPA: ATP-binding protein [Flavitalea sp.]|nr:ATP-binding protein [Flavitalea sp.]
MKPKYGLVYFSFIISLVILVIVSMLFYQRLQSLRSASKQLDHNYSVLFFLNKISNDIKEAETNSRGYILTKDSSFLLGVPELSVKIFRNVDSLKKLFSQGSHQYELSILLKEIASRRLSRIQRNIEMTAYEDTAGLYPAIMQGKALMEKFSAIAQQIQIEEERTALSNQKNKNLFELITPGYFNFILVFSGILTLVSFIFIIRQMRMRVAYQRELERRLNELHRSNAEMEQFTYVASHDLQEPLRKIRTFSDRLQVKYSDSLEPDAAYMLGRMNVSAKRLQELINDMVNFTNLLNPNDTVKPTDLNLVLESCFTQMSTIIAEKHPVLKYDQLPVINGYKDQLELLFKSLLDNALKFSKPDERPFIYISYRKVEGIEEHSRSNNQKAFYHQVIIEDNGIGFDNEFAAKIFMIFQRLHSQGSPYNGKGIGLAICQRVMSNHNGIITAKGEPGKGASIIMYFPVDSKL